MKIIAKVALATLVALPASEATAQKLTFTLNWVAGGDHAPYFYAQKMGLYKQAGLDVDFETGRGSAASAQKVGAGQSQLGLSDMGGVLLFRFCKIDMLPRDKGQLAMHDAGTYGASDGGQHGRRVYTKAF